MSVHFVFYPHKDHIVGYLIALSPPTLLEGMGPSLSRTLDMNYFWASDPSLSSNLSGVKGQYADLWSTCPFSVRILAVIARPTLDPR